MTIFIGYVWQFGFYSYIDTTRPPKSS